MLVIDKETRVGAQQSSHNIGGLYAGLCCPPGSLKARHARAGKGAIEGHKQRALANGIPGVEELRVVQLAEREPHVIGRSEQARTPSSRAAVKGTDAATSRSET